MDLTTLNTRQLLAVYADVLDTLRNRKVTRSANNPLADYAEGLCARALGLTLVHNSTAGYDANDGAGHKFEIKARRLPTKNTSRQLSAIRAIELQKFDFLVGILFASDFSVIRGALIPHAVVKEHGRHTAHTNSLRFMLSDSVWNIEGVEDITDRLKAAQTSDSPVGTLPP
jgi:hypothetical protein